MPKLFTTLLLQLLIVAGLQAQTVSGSVKDETGAAVKGATVSLLRAKDSSIAKFGVSNDKGEYLFVNMPAGNYLVNASFTGFSVAFSAPLTLSGADVKVAPLQLSKITSNLGNVTVTSRKPMVEVKADKMVVNVESTINAIGSDALELLRKSPGVSVDKDDNLGLAGKTGVQVYIDGRPSPLGGQDLANYLKTLQSSQIESIELITNPSARYEAAGNAGIINIKLKKNKSLGVNGSVNAGWSIGTFAKYNAGLSLNYRDTKVNLFGTYSYNTGWNEQRLSLKRTVADSSFDQKSLILVNQPSHNVKVGMDYYIDKKSIFGVMVNGSFVDFDAQTNSSTPIAYIPTGVTNRVLVANNKSAGVRNNLNENLNYTFTNTNGNVFALNADHGNYHITGDQLQPNYYYNPGGTTVINSVIYQMMTPSDITINSVKADWDKNLKKGKISFGGKSSFVETDNDFQRYDVFTSGKILDKDRSNRFRYKENINAAYLSYMRPFKTIMIQVGLRMENTNTDGRSTGLKNAGGTYVNYDSSFQRHYTDLFPSASISFTKNPMNQWTLSYSRRIDRPGYQDLNPFENKLDEYTSQKGNINLRPQYTNAYSVTNVYKGKLVSTLSYSHVSDLFTMLLDTASKSKTFISKQNLATQDIVNLSISYPFQKGNFSMFTSVNTNYSHYKADYGSGRIVDLNAFGLNAVIQNNLRFGKTKTWGAELTAFYNAPTVYMGSFEGKSIYSINAGLSKQIMQGKGSIKVSVSDPFNTLKFRGNINFSGQRTELVQQGETRQIRINFNYRFGNNGVKAARQRANSTEEENKRVGSGSGGLGIGGN
ncbi:TonB-dependent receptor [Sediminibacterium roseum]|uniref:TonB-dependent receptor n=1 Tax=Sediminibacterium roseum TaxID=1978412 RepID=A0ABW9ZRB0_9BACT|nr:TonB-dependent receptor [Sediminibacterium roseum]NCI49638.1 TonB-dependent receptor [Sediminibacterium roseum]